MVNIIKDEYLNDIECDEMPADFEDVIEDGIEDDWRTNKEQRDDMGDYLRDREMDWQHELAERDCGAR